MKKIIALLTISLFSQSLLPVNSSNQSSLETEVEKLHYTTTADHAHPAFNTLKTSRANDIDGIYEYEGEIGLLRAAERGNVEAVKLLLSNKNINVNAQSPGNYTPLMLAGNFEIVELLLSHGADVSFTNDYGEQALDCAVSFMPILDYAYEFHTAENVRIFIAEKIKIIQLLLAHGAVVNHDQLKGESALEKAASKGCPELIAILLMHGARITPLAIINAFSYGYYETAFQLVKIAIGIEKTQSTT